MHTFAQPLNRAIRTAAGSCAVVEVRTEPLPKSAAGKILKRELREPRRAGQQAKVSGG